MPVQIGEFEVVPNQPAPPAGLGEGAEKQPRADGRDVAEEIDRQLARRALRKARLEAS
jgi:hypothetical protein